MGTQSGLLCIPRSGVGCICELLAGVEAERGQVAEGQTDPIAAAWLTQFVAVASHLFTPVAIEKPPVTTAVVAEPRGGVTVSNTSTHQRVNVVITHISKPSDRRVARLLIACNSIYVTFIQTRNSTI